MLNSDATADEKRRAAGANRAASAPGQQGLPENQHYGCFEERLRPHQKDEHPTVHTVAVRNMLVLLQPVTAGERHE